VTGERHAAEEALQDALASACYVRRMIANAHVSAWRRFTDSTRAYVLGPWTAGLSVAEARALAPFFRGTFG
jgi:hypothetical protein